MHGSNNNNNNNAQGQVSVVKAVVLHGKLGREGPKTKLTYQQIV
jgi:hypothetical protein